MIDWSIGHIKDFIYQIIFGMRTNKINLYLQDSIEKFEVKIPIFETTKSYYKFLGIQIEQNLTHPRVVDSEHTR